MDGMDLMHEKDRMEKELHDSISNLKEYGIKKAEHERNYKINYRKEVFRLHEDQGVAWTAAISLAHGDTEYFKVAHHRYNRDLAVNLYDTTQEKINALKLSIRTIESQIAREWGKKGE